LSSNDTNTDRRAVHAALVTEHLWIAADAAGLPTSVTLTPTRLRNYPEDQQDRYQAGVLAMLKMAPGFDPARGTKFSTYVWRSVKRDAGRERRDIQSGGMRTRTALEAESHAFARVCESPAVAPVDHPPGTFGEEFNVKPLPQRPDDSVLGLAFRARHQEWEPEVVGPSLGSGPGGPTGLRLDHETDPVVIEKRKSLGNRLLPHVVSLDDAVGAGENGEPLTLDDITGDPHTLDPAALVVLADERRCRVLDLIHPTPQREDTAMPATNHSRRPLLPWTSLLDGQEHVLVAAEHDRNVDQLAGWVRTRAHSRGLSASVHIDRAAGTVTLQARPKPEQVAA
jgi:hypothetical protein